MSHRKILPFLNNCSKMESWATGERVSVEFLGGCGVMQPGVYGQSLPTDGNTRKRGLGRARPRRRKEVILCGKFPLPSCQPVPGRDAGLRQGSSQEQKMLRMLVRSRATALTQGSGLGGGHQRGPSQATDRLQALFCTSRMTMLCLMWV